MPLATAARWRPATRWLASELGVSRNTVLAAYEHLVEPATVHPTFYTDFPAAVSPLTRPKE